MNPRPLIEDLELTKGAIHPSGEIALAKRLDEAKAGRAVSLSAEKYRSASVMLARTAEITHQVIVEEG